MYIKGLHTTAYEQPMDFLRSLKLGHTYRGSLEFGIAQHVLVDVDIGTVQLSDQEIQEQNGWSCDETEDSCQKQGILKTIKSAQMLRGVQIHLSATPQHPYHDIQPVKFYKDVLPKEMTTFQASVKEFSLKPTHKHELHVYNINIISKQTYTRSSPVPKQIQIE